MSLVIMALVIIGAGVLLYVVEKYVPMDATIKRLLQIVVIVALVLFVLQSFGILQLIMGVKVGVP